MKVLLLANQTLASRKVFERVVWLREEYHDPHIHIVVPLTPSEDAPPVDRDIFGRPVIDYLAVDLAAARLGAARSSIAELEGVTVSGELGAPDPLNALRNALAADVYNRVLLATLPPSSSRWLKLDLIHRARRVAGDIPIDHVVGDVEFPSVRRTPVTWQELGLTASTDALDVLLVDDNEADLELTTVALDRASIACGTRTASSGQEALTMVGDERPDLILLDLSMPGVSGFELLEVLRRDASSVDIPVVILTTSDRDADRDRAHELGAAAYVVKEHDFNRFEAVLHGVLAEVAS